MGRISTRFVCQGCGSAFPKWAGQCGGCGEWNTLVEETLPTHPGSGTSQNRHNQRSIGFVPLQGTSEAPPRMVTGLAELDRVCGGGLVPGSVLLVGGDPGIGKSTLLLQVAAALSGKDRRVFYISGEEAIEQVRLRAERLHVSSAPVGLAAATDVGRILTTLDTPDVPHAVIIDSIQTMFLSNLDSAPGSVAQVRACAHELIRLAKKRGFALFLVGHVTKEGALAGPRVMEHMVDTVLYFEGDRGHHFRILRAVKNRFGATDEIGVFEMSDTGLSEVSNPSALFLAERRGNVSGSCVFAGMEGTRPVLVEVQALMASSGGGSPRRTVVGWDGGRLSMILAVLETRCGVSLGGHDIYLNIAGGLRIHEPAADLAVAAALVSAASATPVPADVVIFGEIGLSGEVRAVTQGELRLKEAAKLGFVEALAPRGRQTAKKDKKDAENHTDGITARDIGHLQDMIHLFPKDKVYRESKSTHAPSDSLASESVCPVN